jgi:hypothetical protein
MSDKDKSYKVAGFMDEDEAEPLNMPGCEIGGSRYVTVDEDGNMSFGGGHGCGDCFFRDSCDDEPTGEFTAEASDEFAKWFINEILGDALGVHVGNIEEIPDMTYTRGPGHGLLGDAYYASMPAPEKVIINDPATVIIDRRGGKVVAKCGHGDRFDPRMGIMVAASKYFGIKYEEIDKYEMLFKMLSGLDSDNLSLLGAMMIMAAEAMRVAGLDA